MTLTKTTTIIWKSAEDQQQLDLGVLRDTKLYDMIIAGKTDGDGILVTPECTTRNWLDQAAAEEYISFITEAAVTCKVEIVSTTITDIAV